MLMISKCLSESIPMPWTLEMCIPLSPGHRNLDVSISTSLGLEWKLTFSSPVATAEFYCSWGSQGKNTEVVCHSHLQWTTLCQASPPWPIRLGWPHTAWLSFIELDKLWSTWSDWLLFCDCGFHLFALWCPLSVPAVLLGFLLPWTWGISSRLLQQSSAAAPYLGKEYFFMATPPDLECGVAPLGSV